MQSKNAALLLIKIVIAGGLILWITQGVDLRGVLALIAQANVPLLVLAFSLFFVGYLITAFRWRTLIRAQGGDAPIPYLVQSFMVAVFFNNFLPSTIGGDVVRMYDAWRLGNSRSNAVAVVVVDRFLGVSVLLLFALVALTIDSVVAQNLPKVEVWAGLAILGFAAACGMILTAPVSWLRERAARTKGIALRLLDFLAKLLESFQTYREARGAIGKAFGLSILLQLNVVIHFTLVAMALGINVPTEAMFLVIPIAVFVMMIPISINAIGVRETVFIVLLSAYGVSDVAALALAWTAYGFSLAQGILGGILFALRKESGTSFR